MKEDELSIFGPHHIHPNGRTLNRGDPHEGVWPFCWQFMLAVTRIGGFFGHGASAARGRERERDRQRAGGRERERERERVCVSKREGERNITNKSLRVGGLGASAAPAHHTDSMRSTRRPT